MKNSQLAFLSQFGGLGQHTLFVLGSLKSPY